MSEYRNSECDLIGIKKLEWMWREVIYWTMLCCGMLFLYITFIEVIRLFQYNVRIKIQYPYYIESIFNLTLRGTISISLSSISCQIASSNALVAKHIALGLAAYTQHCRHIINELKYISSLNTCLHVDFIHS